MTHGGRRTEFWFRVRQDGRGGEMPQGCLMRPGPTNHKGFW